MCQTRTRHLVLLDVLRRTKVSQHAFLFCVIRRTLSMGSGSSCASTKADATTFWKWRCILLPFRCDGGVTELKVVMERKVMTVLCMPRVVLEANQSARVVLMLIMPWYSTGTGGQGRRRRVWGAEEAQRHVEAGV